MIYTSPIGMLELRFDDTALTALRILDEQEAQTLHAQSASAAQATAEVCRWLDAYFSGQEPCDLPPTAAHGTPFQQRVWQELKKIPYGQTLTYGELAQRIGCPSAQAIGQAVGRNPIPIIIPCHRVVAARGLGGYAYGTTLKRRLLQLERIASQ